MKKFAAAGLAMLTVVAAGCSSSKAGTGTPASSASTSQSAPSSAASPSGSPLAKTALASIVLQQADLPAGWTATAHDPDPNDAADQAALVACAGGKNTAGDKVAEADSPDFGLNDATVESSATSYKSPADIQADVALLNSSKISSCYDQLLKTQLGGSLPSGATIDAVSINITPGSATGSSNIAGTGTGSVTVTVSGQQTTIYLAVAFITGPQLEAEVDVEIPGQAVPTDLFTSLVTAVAGRAAKH